MVWCANIDTIALAHRAKYDARLATPNVSDKSYAKQGATEKYNNHRALYHVIMRLLDTGAIRDSNHKKRLLNPYKGGIMSMPALGSR